MQPPFRHVAHGDCASGPNAVCDNSTVPCWKAEIIGFPLMTDSPTADAKLLVQSSQQHTGLLGEDGEKALFGGVNRVLRTSWQVHSISISVLQYHRTILGFSEL